jgi:cysteine desulfurase
MTQPLPVYLDNAATTALDPRVAARMAQVLSGADLHGNAASASHAYGAAANAQIEIARAQVAGAVGCDAGDILWTSGATEADNLAIFGVANYYRDRGRHIVTARTEHKAVLDPCRELEKRGWRITWLAPDERGLLDPQSVARSLCSDTVLVSIMHVNNEIGVVQDIRAIAAVCTRHGVPLHVDAAQSVGKIPLDLRGAGVALASLSAHKIHGPKGVGALVVDSRSGVHLQPLVYGGGQERGMRSGTLPTHQIVGMGVAFDIAARECAGDAQRAAILAHSLTAACMRLGGVIRNGNAASCVAQIVSLSFDGVEGESLLAAVRDRIAVSAGSACASASQEPSYVLRALGHSERLAEATLRFGLGRYTTAADIEVAVQAVTEAVEKLRRIAGFQGVDRRDDAGVLADAS